MTRKAEGEEHIAYMKIIGITREMKQITETFITSIEHTIYYNQILSKGYNSIPW